MILQKAPCLLQTTWGHNSWLLTTTHADVTTITPGPSPFPDSIWTQCTSVTRLWVVQLSMDSSNVFLPSTPRIRKANPKDDPGASQLQGAHKAAAEDDVQALMVLRESRKSLKSYLPRLCPSPQESISETWKDGAFRHSSRWVYITDCHVAFPYEKIVPGSDIQ